MSSCKTVLCRALTVRFRHAGTESSWTHVNNLENLTSCFCAHFILFMWESSLGVLQLSPNSNTFFFFVFELNWNVLTESIEFKGPFRAIWPFRACWGFRLVAFIIQNITNHIKIRWKKTFWYIYHEYLLEIYFLYLCGLKPHDHTTSPIHVWIPHLLICICMYMFGCPISFNLCFSYSFYLKIVLVWVVLEILAAFSPI